MVSTSTAAAIFMRRVITPLFLVLTLSSVAFTQKNSAWREWGRADVDRVLNNSAWGRTQTETDTTEMVFSPTSAGTAAIGQSTTGRGRTGEQQSVNNSRADRGATNGPVSVRYYVRFLSARPIRQAMIRKVELQQEVPDERLSAKILPYENRDFSPYIVVAVDVESQDRRFSGPALQALASATAATLKNITYLERKDGKRLFLMDYRPPIGDGMGGKFVFPRLVDERPFLDLKSGDVRFYYEMTKDIKVNVKFKVSDMVYDGKLEY